MGGHKVDAGRRGSIDGRIRHVEEQEYGKEMMEASGLPVPARVETATKGLGTVGLQAWSLVDGI